MAISGLLVIFASIAEIIASLWVDYRKPSESRVYLFIMLMLGAVGFVAGLCLLMYGVFIGDMLP